MTANRRIAVDANVLVAAIDAKDKRYRVVEALFSTIAAEKVEVVYFDCVVNETISIVARRLEEQQRLHLFDGLLDDLFSRVEPTSITWISGDTERLFRTLITLVRQSNGLLNFHDALIALVCREQDIRFLLSFDQDFDQLGWLTRIDTPTALQQALAAE
ncbi:MAG: type II toxin-antitoxin system VapC family toxin [Anaerolineae bacterium]|nr:type II toxin-antitoxin system VapC family toxin [Anaerolineae bacterium]